MSKDSGTEAFFGGIAAGAILMCVIWGVTSFFTQPADLDKGFRQGYCAAQGGEIISKDICAKGMQIIPTPPRP